MTDADRARITRPIVGLEARTAQEVFDIMCDRLRLAFATPPMVAESGEGEDLEGAAREVASGFIEYEPNQRAMREGRMDAHLEFRIALAGLQRGIVMRTDDNNEEIGFLIEMAEPKNNKPPCPRWWNPRLGWVWDSNDAIRFCREADAKDYLGSQAGLGLSGKVTKHSWHRLPPAAPTSPATLQVAQPPDVQEAIIAGLKSFESDQPDFSMSPAMRSDAADHIIAQPGVWPPAQARGNPVEQALLADADTDLASFKAGDPGKHVQSLIPTPEWKALAKAADRRGSSLSLMLRIAARHYLVWLSAYRTPQEAAADAILSLIAPSAGDGREITERCAKVADVCRANADKIAQERHEAGENTDQALSVSIAAENIATAIRALSSGDT